MSLPPSSFAALNKLIVKGGTKVSLNDRFSRLQKANSTDTGLRGSAVPQSQPKPAQTVHYRAATAAPSYGYSAAPAASRSSYSRRAAPAASRRPAQPMFTPTPLRQHSNNVQLTPHDDEYEDIEDDDADYPRWGYQGHRLSGYSQNASRQRTLQAAFQIKRRLGVRHRLGGAVNKMRSNGYRNSTYNSYNSSINYYRGTSGYSRGYGQVGRGRGGNISGHWRGGGGGAGRGAQRSFYYPRGRGRRPPMRGAGRRGGRQSRQGPRMTKEQLDAQIDEYMANTRSALDKDLDAYMSEKQPDAV